MRLKERLGIILLVIWLAFLPTTAYAATVSDIAKKLICQCGCTSVLSNCTHAECHSRTEMLTLIEQKLSQGQSEEQIISFFVAQYGEQVLAAPPKKGFNLTAWLTPFIALLVGAVVIYIVLKKWVRREAPAKTYAAAEPEESNEKYQHQLEKELAEFTERSFR